MLICKKIVASILLLSAGVGLASEVTESVTITNVKVVGEAPAISMSNIYTQVQQGLPNQHSNACHLAATLQCMAVVNDGKLLQRDESGRISVSMPDEFGRVSCFMTGCDGLTPEGVQVQIMGV